MAGRDSKLPEPTKHGKGPDDPHAGYEGKVNEHAAMLSEHRDRIEECEHRLGIKPKLGQKREDQGGKETNEARKTKEEAARKGTQLARMYERRRHA